MLRSRITKKMDRLLPASLRRERRTMALRQAVIKHREKLNAIRLVETQSERFLSARLKEISSAHQFPWKETGNGSNGFLTAEFIRRCNNTELGELKKLYQQAREIKKTVLRKERIIERLSMRVEGTIQGPHLHVVAVRRGDPYYAFADAEETRNSIERIRANIEKISRALEPKKR